jgi:tetratricopeptide (TPR) repeat protein
MRGSARADGLRRGALVVLAALATGAGVGSCARGGDASMPARHGDASPGENIGFAGCRQVREGPACDLDEERSLRLWLPSQAYAWHVRTDQGALLLPKGQTIDGGTLYRIVLPLAASWLEVWQAESRHRRLFLPVREAVTDPVLARASALRASGRAGEAEEHLRAALTSLAPDVRDRAGALLARLALARGDPDAAIRGLRVAAAQARAAGRVSEALDDLCALAFTLAIHRHRLTEAREVIASAETLAGGFPEGRARLPYYAGLIQAESGDIRKALRELRRAVDRAARLGMEREEVAARQQLADIMSRLGRSAEAVEQQKQVVAATSSATVDPCARAEALIALSWFAMLEEQAALREGRSARTEGAGALLAQARAGLTGCANPSALQVALTNEALYALQRRNLPGAERARRELRGAPGERAWTLAGWELEIDARLALARGHAARALALFRRQDAGARREDDADSIFRAEVGEGRSQRALGRSEEAARCYERAEQTLGELLRQVPLGEGQDSFAGMRAESSRELVTALLESQDLAGSLRAARLARARLSIAAGELQRIDELPPAERARWESSLSAYRQARRDLGAQRAADRLRVAPELEDAHARLRQQLEAQVRTLLDDLSHQLHGAVAEPTVVPLRPPAPGELLLAYFPLVSGWVALSSTPAGVTAHQIGAVDASAPPDVLAGQLLAPFAAELDSARTVRVLPYGALEQVDFHALPFRGAPLVERLAVEYGLDLPARTDLPAEAAAASIGGRPEGGAHPRALLVADPDLSLPGAQIEVDAIRPLLTGLDVHVLRGDDATPAAILAGLPGTRLFHFAGHGWFSGVDGISSALAVGSGEGILLGDIMTVRPCPALVVLSACDAARATRGEGGTALPAAWGVAQAFLAAGARAVVAPTRPVHDAAAGTFMRAFYTALVEPAKAGAPPSSVAEAVRAAQRALRRQRDESAASSFRVLVP